jgi:hypothetical protein
MAASAQDTFPHEGATTPALPAHLFPPPRLTEGRARGRWLVNVSVGPKDGLDSPLPNPSGDLVVHEVVSPQSPGIHDHSAVGNGGMPGWER